MRVRGLGCCLVVMVGVLSGCSTPERSAGVRDVAPVREGIYARADQWFAVGEFYKPRGIGEGDFRIEMAPLIAQEVVAGVPADRIGVARSGPSGPIVVDVGTPVVYRGKSTVVLGDQTYDRVSYVWFYVRDEGGGALSAQGVRMTLDTAGFPRIWEVLGDSSGERLVFVARSLEEAAAKQFGALVAGCRFAIESGDDGVVVARTVSDGPMPMGPWVYVEAGTRDVGTIICRCSPAQIDEFVVTREYELWPMESLVELGVDFSKLFPVDGSDDPGRLDRVLRLPAMK